MLTIVLAVALTWDTDSIASLARAIEREGLDPHEAIALLAMPEGAARDALAADTFLRVAAQLQHGVVDPQFARPAWCPPAANVDLSATLQSALENRTIEETLARLAPRHPGYVRLRDMLARYREAEWNVVPEGRALRRGDDDARVTEVRRRLGSTSASTVFDAELDALVRHFQSHHGIAEDGVVGAETLREMNVPASARVRQIAINMERWRWMPEELGARYVVVNIAAFRLDVIEGDRSALTMKTVVGKEYTRTPFFAARMTDVVVNPWWNVPDSIAAKELWPLQRRDGSYFARHHMVVSRGRIRQKPGPWNALGRLKFNMPNPYNVYLHDTPSKSLFARTYRAFSHGCIRVERPLELAEYLLGAAPSFDGGERSIPLSAPVPVYVLYWTAWVGDDGHMEFHRDHYARDAALASHLFDALGSRSGNDR